MRGDSNIPIFNIENMRYLGCLLPLFFILDIMGIHEKVQKWNKRGRNGKRRQKRGRSLLSNDVQLKKGFAIVRREKQEMIFRIKEVENSECHHVLFYYFFLLFFKNFFLNFFLSSNQKLIPSVLCKNRKSLTLVMNTSDKIDLAMEKTNIDKKN